MADSQARIFISYRREDTAGHVLALLPELRRHFGDRVFKDTDNIPPGEDFVRFIKSELDSCSVLLAVIGRDWLTVQDPRLKTRRLDNPDDFLRIEVATALKSERIRVIPVLVERSTMPSAADLPLDMAELAHRNALELSDARWESDVRLLIQAIQRAFAPAVEPAEALPRQELQDFQKRRAREITAHTAAGQEAFDAQDYEGTLLSCEKVLLLDPKSNEALELLDRARKAIDNQKIENWLKQAGESLGRGDIARASDFIDQALSIDPASETALGLRKDMLAVRRDRERDRERTRAVAAALQRARASLDEEDLDAAVRQADDALALEPQSAEAQDVRSRAVAALDERRRRREARRRAQQAATDPREHAGAEREREPASGVRELSAFPQSWSIGRYGSVGAAAAGILGLAIGVWQYQRVAEPAPARETTQTLKTPGPAAATNLSATVASGRETPSGPSGRETPSSPSGRETPSSPIEASTTRPRREKKQPADTGPSEKEKVQASSVAPVPAKPLDPGPSRATSISEILREQLQRKEEPLIADLMQRYVTAYNSRNVAAVKELYPSFDGHVREGFDRYDVEGMRIELSPDWLSATVSGTERFYFKEQITPGSIECLFTLRKEGDSWIIVSIARGIRRNFRA